MLTALYCHLFMVLPWVVQNLTVVRTGQRVVVVEQHHYSPLVHVVIAEDYLDDDGGAPITWREEHY